MSLPQEEREEIQTLAELLLACPSTTARRLLTFLGKVTFVSIAVPLARLHTRADSSGERVQTPGRYGQTGSAPLGSQSQPGVLAVPATHASPPQAPSVIMATDASGTGWGASLHSISAASGQWSTEEKRHHISYQEILAVQNVLLTFLHRVKGKYVCVQIDNTATVSNVSGEGRGDQVASAITSSLPHSPAVDVSTLLRVPTPDPGSECGEQTEGVHIQDATNRTLLERRPLVTHATGVNPRRPTPIATVTGPPDQRVNRVSSEQPTESTPHSMGAMRQAAGCSIQPATFSVLESKSGVPTSVWTYLQFV